jgi:predicted XRE-type DNA-binding protein
MEALWLKNQQLPHRQISTLVGISSNTLRIYLQDYQEFGIEKFKEINFYHHIELETMSLCINPH